MSDPATILATIEGAWKILTEVAVLFKNSVSTQFKAGDGLPTEIGTKWPDYTWKDTGTVEEKDIYRFFASNTFWPTDDEVKINVSYTYGDVYDKEGTTYIGSFITDVVLDAELVTEAAPSSIELSGSFGTPKIVEDGDYRNTTITGKILAPKYTYFGQQYGAGKGKTFTIDAKGVVGGAL